MEIKGIQILNLISLLHGAIFGVLILCSKFYRSPANRYLGFAILVGVLINLYELFFIEITFDPAIFDIDEYIVLLILEQIQWVFLFPVLFFFYYYTSTHYDTPLPRKYKLLYIPFYSSLAFNFGISILELIDEEMLGPGIEVWFTIEGFSAILFNAVLVLWSYFIIQSTPRDTRSTVSRVCKKWMLTLWCFQLTLIIVWIGLDLFIAYYNFNDSYELIWVFLSFLFYWVGYQGIHKFKLAKDRYEIHQILEEKQKDIKETQHTDTTTNKYYMHLERLMNEEKLFRDPEINRDQIAALLGISAGYFSQMINGVTGKSFSEYLTYYRVKEVKQMLKDPEFEKYSLLAIGFEAGFKSKSSFYTSFKNETGQTPNMFKKSKA